MKILKTFLYLLSVTAVLSCEKSDVLDANPLNAGTFSDDKAMCSDFNVSLETATYAASFLDTATLVSIEPVVYNSCDTVAYVVDYDMGWKVLSADMRATPVLVSSPKGHYDINAQNPGSKYWIQKLLDDVSALKQDKRSISYAELKRDKNYQFWKSMYLGAIARKHSDSLKTKLKSIRKIKGSGYTIKKYFCKRLLSSKRIDYTTHFVGERTSTRWGQESPWNECLPLIWSEEKAMNVSAYVGCTAVAMGQLLYHAHRKWGVPSGLYHGAHFTGTASDKKYVPGVYVANSSRWDMMAKLKGKRSDSTIYVSEFFAELGNKLNIKYSSDGSRAWPSVNVIKDYGLTWDEGNYNRSVIEDNLRKSIPVMIVSYSKSVETGKKEGHTWLIDALSEDVETIKKDYEWVIVAVEEPVYDDSDNDMDNNGKGNIGRSLNDKWSDKKFEIIDGNESAVLIYWSYDKMRRDFVEVVSYEEGRSMGLKNCSQVSEVNNFTATYFMMNWGYGDFGDKTGFNEAMCDVIRFAPNATEWACGVNLFRYNTKIYFNLRKK